MKNSESWGIPSGGFSAVGCGKTRRSIVFQNHGRETSMRDGEQELPAEQLQQIKAAAQRKAQEFGPVSVETMRRVLRSRRQR